MHITCSMYMHVVKLRYKIHNVIRNVHRGSVNKQFLITIKIQLTLKFLKFVSFGLFFKRPIV
jgi:hypothetical protein